jgi:hypothetical protein
VCELTHLFLERVTGGVSQKMDAVSMSHPRPCGFGFVVALPLVALFLATVLLPIETYLL